MGLPSKKRCRSEEPKDFKDNFALAKLAVSVLPASSDSKFGNLLASANPWSPSGLKPRPRKQSEDSGLQLSLESLLL